MPLLTNNAIFKSRLIIFHDISLYIYKVAYIYKYATQFKTFM